MTAADKIFAISDVHGCAGELRQLLQLLPITTSSTVVMLGDYIDCGPRSREVVEVLIELSATCRVVALTGNHEDMFHGFLQDPASHAGMSFIYNGGGATLASYANAHAEYNIPDSHKAFFAGLQLYHATDEYFFVHAGVPELPLENLGEAHRHDLLWIRGEFFESKYKWSKRIIHGHTPVQGVTLLPNRINIDTGCVLKNALSAIELPSEKIYSVPRVETQQRRFLKDSRSNRVAVRFEGTAPVFVRVALGVIAMETQNYNEFGILARVVTLPEELQLRSEQKISGYLQLADRSALAFQGTVLRRTENPDGVFYAIGFDRPTIANL